MAHQHVAHSSAHLASLQQGLEESKQWWKAGALWVKTSAVPVVLPIYRTDSPGPHTRLSGD